MRRSKDINIFSVTFIDLISGALGAVMILYIIVPKNDINVPQKENVQLDQALVTKMQLEKNALNEKLLTLTQEYEKLKFQLEQKEVPSTKALSHLSNNVKNTNQGILPVDVGFKFRGKHILFIIDISGSMWNE